MQNKIKISQKELDELYEVEQDLTQPKIEDNIDNKKEEKPEPEFLTEEELEIDTNFHQDDEVPEQEILENA